MTQEDPAAVRHLKNLKNRQRSAANRVWAYCREHCNSLDSERGVKLILDGMETADASARMTFVETVTDLNVQKKLVAKLEKQISAFEKTLAMREMQITELQTAIAALEKKVPIEFPAETSPVEAAPPTAKEIAIIEKRLQEQGALR